MKTLKLSYYYLINIFVSFFKVINENSQINILRSVGKDNEGNTILFISPLTSPESYPIYPHQIINNHYLKSQFRKFDIKIIESLVVSEGDIFIVERKYNEDNSYIKLQSIISMETWSLPEENIINDIHLFNRINKRFFTRNMVLKNAFHQ